MGTLGTLWAHTGAIGKPRNETSIEDKTRVLDLLGLLIERFPQCWNGGERWSTIKGTLNLPVLTCKVNTPAFMCFLSFFVYQCISINKGSHLY